MNVFVRAMPQTHLREWLLCAVLDRLTVEVAPESRCVLTPENSPLRFDQWEWKAVSVPTGDFHLASKRKAAELATTDWLLIVDDDQLPLYRDWVGYAVSLTKRFPDYSAIAGWSVTHEVPRPESLIAESDSIGCPMIVKRAALLDATSEPIENPQRADTILTGRLQRHGKTGIARNWRYNHLGMGYSQVIPAHWMPECPV